MDEAKLAFINLKLESEEKERFAAIVDLDRAKNQAKDAIENASARIAWHDAEIRRLQAERRAILVPRLMLVGVGGGMPIWEEN